MSLVAEALDLPPDAFDAFYKPSKERMQHRSKVRYTNSQRTLCCYKYVGVYGSA